MSKKQNIKIKKMSKKDQNVKKTKFENKVEKFL